MKTTIDITLEIEALSVTLSDLRRIYKDATEYEKEKIEKDAKIIKARMKALQISLDMREHKGKRVVV